MTCIHYIHITRISLRLYILYMSLFIDIIIYIIYVSLSLCVYIYIHVPCAASHAIFQHSRQVKVCLVLAWLGCNDLHDKTTPILVVSLRFCCHARIHGIPSVPTTDIENTVWQWQHSDSMVTLYVSPRWRSSRSVRMHQNSEHVFWMKKMKQNLRKYRKTSMNTNTCQVYVSMARSWHRRCARTRCTQHSARYAGRQRRQRWGAGDRTRKSCPKTVKHCNIYLIFI